MNGIDVSHHNDVIDWGKVAGAGIEFAYVKATQGDRFLDPRYAINTARSKDQGIKNGCYHFFEPDIDPVAQADHYLGQWIKFPFDLAPALDVEKSGGLTTFAYARAVRSWLAIVELNAKVRPIIYTSASFWDAHVAEWLGWKGYQLWVAHYTTNQAPMLPKPWATWALWQHSSEGKVPGISVDVDLNRMSDSA